MLAAANKSNEPSLYEAVTSFVDAAESVADLRLLKAVDETVDALGAARRFYVAHNTAGRALTAKLRGMEVVSGRYLDPEDKLIDMLSEGIDRSESELATMVAKKAAVDDDGRLGDHHCDMLHGAFDDAITALGLMIDVIHEMRAAVIAHDLAAEPRDVPAYANVLELKRAIGR